MVLSPPMATLVVTANGAAPVWMALGGDEILIGRHAPATIRLDDPRVSSLHAKVWTEGDLILLRDLGSRNGTRVNGTPVSETAVAVGDRIQIGDATLIVASDDKAEGILPRTRPASANRVEFEAPALGSRSLLRLKLAKLRESEFEGAPSSSDDDVLALVWRAGEKLNLLLDHDAIFKAVRQLGLRAFPHARAFVLAPGEEGTTPIALAGQLEGRAPSNSVVAEAVRSRSAVLSSDIAEDERFRAAASVVASNICTAMAAPLMCKGEPLAVIYLDRVGGRGFVERDLRLLGLIANHVASVLENATLVAELRGANLELEGAHAELSLFSQELERKVEERTAEVRRQAAEISHLAREKDELLGIAAHDIRGPLSTIVAFIDLAREGLAASNTESLNEDLGVIGDAARTMNRLLSDLLDVKKIEAGRIHFERAEIPADEFLARATALGAMHARQRGIHFRIEVAPGLVLWADPRRLDQAVANLVSNALKFTHEGGSVTVAARPVGAGAEVNVIDTGPGIGPEDLARLFQAYVQGEAGKAVVGTGLGLAIAKKLVELHDGRIWVESLPGKGSRFAFVIPSRGAGAPPR